MRESTFSPSLPICSPSPMVVEVVVVEEVVEVVVVEEVVEVVVAEEVVEVRHKNHVPELAELLGPTRPTRPTRLFVPSEAPRLNRSTPHLHRFNRRLLQILQNPPCVRQRVLSAVSYIPIGCTE